MNDALDPFKPPARTFYVEAKEGYVRVIFATTRGPQFIDFDADDAFALSDQLAKAAAILVVESKETRHLDA